MAFLYIFCVVKEMVPSIQDRQKNIEKRVKRHNSGLVKSTKNRYPFDFVYSESYSTRREAMLREKHLKSIGGVKEKKAIIKKITEGLQLSWESA